MEPLTMGDMTITDDGDLGLSIHANGEKLSFINALGEIALMEWIYRKYGRGETPSANNLALPTASKKHPNT